MRSIADYVGLSTGVISGTVVGEHGDSQVPLWSKVSIAGEPIDEYCRDVGLRWDESVRAAIAGTTRDMGMRIIENKGRTHYAIATCVCHLADAIVNQRPTIVSVSSPLLGEHGVRDVALSVPSAVGPAGVQQRIRERWNPEEYRAFFDAALKMKEMLAVL